MFFDNVSQSRSMIYFKNSLYKILKKYHLLKKSSLQANYFKNNSKAIKIVCKENPTSFVQIIFIIFCREENFEEYL